MVFWDPSDHISHQFPVWKHERGQSVMWLVTHPGLCVYVCWVPLGSPWLCWVPLGSPHVCWVSLGSPHTHSPHTPPGWEPSQFSSREVQEGHLTSSFP